MRKVVIAQLACVVALVPALAWASPPRIVARLRASEVEVGEPTVLDVTVSGAANGAVHVPQVATLDIEPLGTSHEVRIVNGSSRESITQHYRVVPRRAGRFAIGPITAAGASTPALILDVRPAGARSRRARTSRSSAEPAGRRAMLRVRVPKRRLTVGESVPITIRAYVKAGTAGTITGVPQLGSDAFAIHDLVDRAQQGQTEIDGTPYATLTWRGRLTALLPGDQSMKATLPVTLRWREIVQEESPDPLQDRVRSMFDRFFDDPFGTSPVPQQRSRPSSFFGPTLGPERSAEVVLEHDAGTVHVVEPPAEGRPADFGGAIGRFTIHAEVTPAHVRVGEPLTVRLTVEGEGTFERVTHELFGEDARFRAYPATSRFTDGEPAAKVLEQSIVPIAPGALELAPLTFSYYDPRARRYVTLASDPLHVDVEPGASGTVRDLDDAREQALPRDLEPGRFVERLWPVPRVSLWLLACCALMGVAVAGGVALARRDPALAKRRRLRRKSARAVRASRRAMRSASRRGDPSAFYRSARVYVQRRLGGAFGVAPDAVTLAEAEARLARVPEAVRDVLERADAIAFAGASAEGADLRATCERLERAMDEVPER